MTNWTIRRRVIWSFALILGLMALMGGFAVQRLSHIAQLTSALEDDSLPGLELSSQIMALTLTSYAQIQEHVISVDPAAMHGIEQALQTGVTKMNQLVASYAATIREPTGKQKLTLLADALVPFSRVEADVLRLSRELRNEEAHALVGSKLTPEFRNVEKSVQGLFDYNKTRAYAGSREISGAVRAATLAVVSTGVLALLFAVLSGFALLRAITSPLTRLLEAVDLMRTGDLSRRLTFVQQDEFATLADGFNRMRDELGSLVGHIQRSGIQVNTSVTQIAATAKQQQATATEIATTSTEIGATSREISATSRELVKTMTEVASFAEQSAGLANHGQAGLKQMETTMRRVMEATGAINAKLGVLNDKAANIGQVVTTISRVADQTNLLSLNAAIEAEKAGEYGRGFAVVATEIRRLADQTAVASGDIEQMVREIQSAVSAGVMGMDRFSEEVRGGMQEVQQVAAQLSQIIQQVQALAPRCEAVSEGVQAQSTGADQISQALVQLTEAAQQTVESLRQSTMAIADLNHVASGLRTAITRFKLDSE
jgi:methyl-accepting chemotaxis protein WspA